MEFTIVVGLKEVQIFPKKLTNARRFYIGSTTRYYIAGGLQGRRGVAVSAMMSHAYEQGEKLATIRSWKAGE